MVSCNAVAHRPQTGVNLNFELNNNIVQRLMICFTSQPTSDRPRHITYLTYNVLILGPQKYVITTFTVLVVLVVNSGAMEPHCSQTTTNYLSAVQYKLSK